MTTKQELLQLSKREIIRRFLDLEKRLEKIEYYLKAFDNAHTPSSKILKKNTDKGEKRDSAVKKDELPQTNVISILLRKRNDKRRHDATVINLENKISLIPKNGKILPENGNNLNIKTSI